MKDTLRIEDQGNNRAFVADTVLLTALRAHAEAHVCQGIETLFCQGGLPEAVFLLREGQVTLTTEAAGRRRVFARQTMPGSIFGLPGVIGDTPYSLTAMADSGTQLEVVSREAFHRLLRERPEMSFHALRILAAEVQAARKILQGPSTKTRRVRRAEVSTTWPEPKAGKLR